LTRDDLYSKLADNNINGRRYFYPLVSEHSMYRHIPSANFENLKNAYQVSRGVICLPLYPSLLEEDQDRIIRLISEPNGIDLSNPVKVSEKQDRQFVDFLQ
jgi:dTDP-4-amino-4,6-dideoxygalactose transaminase